ncbi:MAG: C39 family peptidase [Methanosarcinales archaeon]
MDESQLRDLIESYGLKTDPVKNLEKAISLIQEGKPVVALVDRAVYAKGSNHWIVLRGVYKNTFAVSDPADTELRRLEKRT